MKPLTLALILESPTFRAAILEALEGVPVRIVVDQGGVASLSQVSERLERLLPHVVLLDLGERMEERFALVQQIRALKYPPAVVVCHDSGDAGIILRAMRAGAAEFLTLPLEDASALVYALERLSALVPSGQAGRDSGGALYAFLAAKGGAGATTLACGAAAALGKGRDREILLADLDLETGNVAFALKAAPQYSILDACRNLSRLDPHYWRGLVTNGLPGVHVLSAPADPPLLGAPQEVEVRQVLSFVRSVYDCTVVDLPSGLSSLTRSVLDDADPVFLVTRPDLPSLHRAKRALHVLSHSGYPLGRVRLVVNGVSRRDEVSAEDIQRNLGAPVFWRFPLDPEGVTEFYMKGGVAPPKSDIGRSLRQFIDEISSTGSSGKKKSRSWFGL